MQDFSGDLIMRAIRSEVLSTVERIVAEEVAKAAQEVDRRVREASPRIAAQLFETMTMSRHGPDLVITFKHLREQDPRRPGASGGGEREERRGHVGGAGSA